MDDGGAGAAGEGVRIAGLLYGLGSLHRHVQEPAAGDGVSVRDGHAGQCLHILQQG